MTFIRWCLVLLILLQGVLAARKYSRDPKYSQKYSSSTRNGPIHSHSEPKRSKAPRQQKDQYDDTYIQNEIKRMTSMIENCYFPTGGYVCELPVGGQLRLQCIPASRVCDGEVDCPLADDERDCPPIPEPVTGFTATQICCLDGTFATVCDTVSECPGGVDENCGQASTCAPNQVQCPNGKCATVCDENAECCDTYFDALDELRCREGTNPGEYAFCGDGNFICDDTVNQCLDNIDESVCHLTCEIGQIGCESEADTMVDICATLCNAVTECDNGIDEQADWCGVCAGDPCIRT